ncbi:MAG: DUF1295 domain-containing protein, partial [Phycisphaeraceae bacterium]|nr:DUF1295 domain-containing protein [Phycisphaeraceae bacterium]
MMPSWQLLITLLVAWLLSAILMTALWRRQRRGRNAAAVVDVAWSFCTGLVAMAGAAMVDGDPGRRLLVAGLALAWAVRLGVHLVQRLRREGEDGRYEMMKERWGGEDERASDRKMLGFYQLQAAWTVGFALPLIAAAAGDKPPGQWHDFAAVAIWLIGWAGEAVADRQLAAFKAEADRGGEKTRVC